ncbi:MAG TPA: inositol monophosphatase family protein [Ignavibacteria bacterium]
MNENLNDFKNFGLKLIEKSSVIIKKYYRKKIKIENKNDYSPVTRADKYTEKIIKKMILKEYPHHGVLGEELGEINSSAVYKWVIDPIDGTKTFISGVPLFGTLIALLKDETPIMGIINLPILGETLIGDGFSTVLNGNRTYIRPCNSISNAVLLTTDLENIRIYSNINKFMNLVNKVKLFRTWGDCYGYYLLSTGYADIMIDPIMSSWDLLALIPIINGAGGVITDFSGNNPISSNSIIASSKLIHEELILLLN